MMDKELSLLSQEEDSEVEDRVRERIMRQNPRPYPAPKYVIGTLEEPRCAQPDEVQIKNRFQHRDKSLLLPTESRLPARVNMVVSQGHENTGVSQIDLANTGNSNGIMGANQSRVSLEVNESGSQKKPVTVVEAHSTCNGTDNFCKACGEMNTLVFENNRKTCSQCGAFTLANVDGHIDINIAHRQATGSNHVEMEPKSRDCPGENIKRKTLSVSEKRKKVKRKADDKVCLMISSDEEDVEMEWNSDNEKTQQKMEHSINKASTSSVSAENTASQTATPKFADRMKLPGGKLPGGESSSNVKEKQAETAHSSNQLDQLSAAGLAQISIGPVRFGLFLGEAISLMSLEGAAIKIDIECKYQLEVEGDGKKTKEKYKLQLGPCEVDHIIVNDAEEPLFICLVPSKAYSDLVNKALGRSVLDVDSDVPAKRQMIFFVQQHCSLFSRIINHNKPNLEKIADIHVNPTLAKEILSTLSEDFASKEKTYVTRHQAHKANFGTEDVRNMFIYPPPPQKGGISITTMDISCLEPGVYLNDIIIDFYLKYLFEEKLDPAVKENTYIFNTYFYTRLAKKLPCNSDKSLSVGDRMHSQVKKWTRNVDIFEKDYIIIPVNEHAHWYLVVICFPSEVQNCVPKSPKADVVSPSIKVKKDASDVNSDNSRDTAISSVSLSSDSEKMDTDFKSPDTTLLSKGVFETSCKSPTPAASPILLSPTCSKSVLQSKNTRTKNTLDKRQPCILIFDSLVSGGRSRVFTNLRNYLTVEWKEKRGDTHPEKVFTKDNIKGSFPKVPLQNNDCDCGVYLLQFAESFFENPITMFKPPIKLHNWFSKERVDNKRGQIKDLIFHLEKVFTGKDS